MAWADFVFMGEPKGLIKQEEVRQNRIRLDAVIARQRKVVAGAKPEYCCERAETGGGVMALPLKNGRFGCFRCYWRERGASWWEVA